MTKEDFIKDSIKDIQDTIRALDRKLFGTLVLTLLPFTQTTNISFAIKTIYKSNDCFAILLCILLILFWFIGFISSCIGIYSIGNPAKHVLRENETAEKKNIKVSGAYYNPEFFSISFWGSFFTTKVKSIKTLDQHILDLKKIEKTNYEELVFEQCKVTYIREIKMKRQKNALIFIILSVVTIGIIFLSDSIIKP